MTVASTKLRWPQPRSRSSIGILAGVVCVSCTLASCVRGPALRKVDSSSASTRAILATPGTKEAEAEARGAQIEKYNGYWIAHTEFDDFGTFANVEQLDQIEHEVTRKGAKGLYKNGMTIVVFIHGWQNNASRNNRNLRDFRALVSKLAPKELEKGRGVLGVYLSWKGETTKIPVLRQLSYWNRKATAHTIGDGNLMEALVRIKNLNLTLAERSPKGFNAYYANTRLILLAHSFGAAALYSAVADPLKHDFMQAYYKTTTHDGDKGGTMPLVSGFGDLVLLINPAFEALRYRAIDHHIRSNKNVDYDDRQPVLMLIAASAGDTATKSIFPIAQTVGNPARILKSWMTRNEKRSNAVRGRQLMTTVGNADEFVTHQLRINEANETVLEAVPSKRYGGIKKTLKLQVPPTMENTLTPFMVVDVNTKLIRDHGAIWDEAFGNFIVKFAALQSAHIAKSKPAEARQIKDELDVGN